MQRYFFNIADGSCVRDPQGDVLPGLDQANQMALAVMSELLPMQHSSLLVAGERPGEVRVPVSAWRPGALNIRFGSAPRNTVQYP
ncbi:DUF6894 family protein [Brevundimonas vesicularis]|uniref:DUF6894 family protein n=1 Tax=Brevundimonas vesicularis TaxID=41276 RepID=UPI000B2FFBF0|nr:hypothetical protein [Brevundimonas vesicularis]